jgi:tetratricopeptide (TPR) repeat protein
VLTLGSLEGGAMGQSVRRGFVPLMKDRAPTRADFTFVDIPEETHNRAPYRALHDGLEALFADWAVPTAVVGKGLEAVERFYEELSRRTGYAIDVPLSVYRQLASTLPDVESALAAARLAVEHYPSASDAFASLGRLQQLKGDLDAARTSYERALELESNAPIPYSERLLAIRRRLDALRKP